MFYVRARLADDVSVEIDITGENVFTSCADCGAEIRADLDELIGLDGFSMSSALCCEACSARRLAEGGAVV